MTSYHSLSHWGQVARLKVLGREALKEFGIVPTRMEHLVHAENTTFRIWQGEEQFNLRIHRPGYQTEEAIRSELQFLAALHAGTDIIAPDPVRALSGDFLVKVSTPGVPEERKVVLFRWVHGRFGRKMLPSQAKELGRLMARIQIFAKSFQPPPGFIRRKLDFDGALGEETEASLAKGSPAMTEPERQYFWDEFQGARQMMRDLGKGPDVYGLIHADLHTGNVLWQPGGRAAAIDFDDLGYAHYVYDFACALAFTVSLPNAREIRDNVLVGYAEVAPLPPRTDELLNAFLKARLLMIVAWVISRTDNPKLTANAPIFVERFMARMKIVDSWG